MVLCIWLPILLTWASQKAARTVQREKKAPPSNGAIMHLTGTALPRPVPFQPSPAVDVCLAADPAPPAPYQYSVRAVRCNAVQRTTTIYSTVIVGFCCCKRAVYHGLHRSAKFEVLHKRILGVG